MKRIKTICSLLTVAILATATPLKPRPEIMGIALGMSRADARTRLQSMGTLEREAQKQQEVWVVKDQRISHLLVGYVRTSVSATSPRSRAQVAHASATKKSLT